MPPAKKRRVAAATAAAAADEANGDFISNKNSAHMNKLLQQHRESLDTLLHIVAELSSDSNNKKLSESILSSSLALTNLKSLQRQIALQVEAQANESKEQRAKVEECSLMLENLTYERNYLQREIGSLEGWKADELEKMAWAELGMEDPSSKNNNESISSEDVVMGGDDTEITTSEAAINAYLFGKSSDSSNDHRDPKNHTAIVQKLQTDLETRSSLVDELSQSKLKLKELQKKRDELREFLNNQIPKKLGELEKGAESLNNFFGSHNVWNEALKVGKNDGDGVDDVDDDVKTEKLHTANMLVNRPSFDRSKRFQLAKSNLPPPLYVLYVQLVGYRDAWASLEKVGECDGNKPNALGGFVGADGMDVNVDNANESNEWRVILTLSTSDILPAEVTSTFGGRTASSNSRSSSPTPGPNSLSIVFSYDKEDGVVYALADLDGNKDLGEELLDNLFPEDDGSTLPNVSLSLLNQEEDEESDDNEGEGSSDMMESTTVSTKPEKKSGKAFYWCQILSGLNFAPPTSSWDTNVATDTAGDNTPFEIQICTKAVMRQLLRRIRARQSLACMVDFLGRRGQFGIPIHPAMKSDNASNTPTPKAKLQSFAKEEEMKVYVATIKRKSSTLKATVTISSNYPAEPSVWTLQNEDGSSGSVPPSQSSDNNKDALFDPNLARIECHVNQDLEKFVCQDVEATYDWILTHQLADIVSCWDELMSAKEEGNTNKMKGDGRLRKGKDRRLIGFGEKSPFFWYRKGL